MAKINEYNKKVQNWDFGGSDVLEFLRLLKERNIYILEQTSVKDFHSDCREPSKNVATIDFKHVDALEYIAFHVGFPHQIRLYSLIEEETGEWNNRGVFFSLKPADVVYFSEFESNPFSMVYLLDSRLAEGARVQKKYDHSVISRHDLEDMLYATKGRDKASLGSMHRRLNRIWTKKNTIPFNVEQLKDFKEKGYDWLVIPHPIDVVY